MGLKDWSHNLRERAFLKTSLEEQQATAERSGPPLKRCLGALDVLLLGIGATVGSGIFVVTGVAAAEHAGPSVSISYLLAATAALLSGLCYTQLVVDMPVAGGATFYMATIFGEFVSWIVAANLILESSLSVAAVGRSASGYFATLLGLDPAQFLWAVGPVKLDPFSLLLVLLLSALLAYGTEASNMFNIVVTGLNIVVIVYILCAGFPFAKAENLVPFFPYGVHGTFDAAAIVFFSFVGFDSAATAAEEVLRPERDMPIGMLGAIAVSAILYVLMCFCISLMQPSSMIDLDAPFAAAFTSLIQPSSSTLKRAFLKLSARFVSFGALTDYDQRLFGSSLLYGAMPITVMIIWIVTSLLVSVLGQARIYVVLGRSGLLPRWLASIHTTRNTPANSTWMTGISSGLLAFLVDLDTLAELVSIGTLFVFFMVALGVLWQRYSNPTGMNPWLSGLVAANVFVSLGLSLSYTFKGSLALLVVFGSLWLMTTGALCALPVAYRPANFSAPLSPFTPVLAMLVTLHLICSLGWKAYVRFAVWLLLSVLVYVLYGAHNAASESLKLTASRQHETESAPLRPSPTLSTDIQLLQQNREVMTEGDRDSRGLATEATRLVAEDDK